MESFTPNGKFRLVLEEVGTDQDGDRSWQTVFEVTDTQTAITDAWLPSLAVRLGGADLVLDGPVGPAIPMPVAVNGDGTVKRGRGRPKKAVPAPAEALAAQEAASAEPTPEAPAEVPPPSGPVFNPFAAKA